MIQPSGEVEAHPGMRPELGYRPAGKVLQIRVLWSQARPASPRADIVGDPCAWNCRDYFFAFPLPKIRSAASWTCSGSRADGAATCGSAWNSGIGAVVGIGSLVTTR